MKLILGGSMSRVGALSECPFQGDESIHSAGNGLGGFWGHCGLWHREVGGDSTEGCSCLSWPSVPTQVGAPVLHRC